MSLATDHKSDLEKSGLSEETIFEARINSLCPANIDQRLKRFGINNTYGIASVYEIPYDESYSRFRIFYEKGKELYKNGKHRGKYKAPANQGNHLYIPSKCKAVLQDRATPLCITEGEKKALKAIQEGIFCIAISGLWNWKVKNKEELIPDFDKIALDGRTIYLVPDNDFQELNKKGEEKNLKRAVNELAYLLIDRGAKVLWIELPVGELKGIDDYLCKHSIEEFHNLPKNNIKKKTIEEAINELFSDPPPNELKEIIKRISLINNETEKEQYIKKLSKKTSLTLKSIRTDVNKYIKYSRENQNLNKNDEEIIEEFNKDHAVVMLGGKCVILTQKMNPALNRLDVVFSSPQDLKNFYANREINNTNAFTHWFKHPKRRAYKGIVFAPKEEIPEHYNLWRGFAVKPIEGDCQLFLNHIKNVISDGNEEIYKYIITWMADVIQNPQNKPGTSIVLRGKQGTGKSIVCKNFGRILGSHYLHIQNSRHLVGNFNAHLKNALLVFADEAFWAGDKSAEGLLKAMVTEETIMIEPKGIDPFPVKNHIHLMIASNNDWVVPAGLEERRFFVIDVSEKHMQDKEFFGAIQKEMDNGGREALLYYFENYDLKGIELRTFPQTNALFEQKLLSMNSVEKFWYLKLMNGSQLDESDEWIMGSVSKKQIQEEYHIYARKTKLRYPMDICKFGRELHKLVPGLKDTKPVGVNGTRYHAYEFPSLGECREYFQKKVKIELPWSGESAALIEPTGTKKNGYNNNLSDGAF